jgi:DNA-binding transcriptional LysR family regulator
MDLFRAMRVFRRVVELGRFSAAARDQKLSNAAVSKEVAALEDHLGATLLHRTTRRLSLTSLGREYYARCVQVLDQLEEAERSVAASPFAGTLRVNVPMSFGLLHVAPLIPAALKRWPELALDVRFTDRMVGVVEEGADIVVRIASELPDAATLLVRRLARSRRVLCASPAYLSAHGEPKSIEDLAGHECLVYSGDRAAGQWVFRGSDGPARFWARGRLLVDNSIVIREALLAGLGISLLPAFYVGAELASGKLRAILTRFEPKPVIIHALANRSRQPTPRARAFVDFLRERFASADWAIR